MGGNGRLRGGFSRPVGKSSIGPFAFPDPLNAVINPLDFCGAVVDTKAMAAFNVEEHFHRHMVLTERGFEIQAVLHFDRGVIHGMYEINRRRAVRHLQFIGIFPDLFRAEIRADQTTAGFGVGQAVCKTDDGINEHGEIGSQACVLRIINIVL